MNILYVQDTDWIRKNPIQHNHLAERMVLRGHNVRVIDYEFFWKTEGKKELISKRQEYQISRMLKNANHTVIRPELMKLPIFDYASMFYFYKKEIKRQINELKPDVIIGDGIITPFLAFHFAKKHEITTVYYCIDIDYRLIPQGFVQPVGKLIERNNIKQADCVISINESLREYTIRMGAKREKTKVIRAGIDTAMFNLDISGDEIREKYGISRKDKLLFFVGWLYHFSGLKEVAMDLAHLQRDDIKLLVVGDGDAYDDLTGIQEDYGLKNKMILTGRQDYNLLPKFLAAADICLLPAYNNEIMRDIVPIKLYEYMAMENPIIATKLPGIIKEFDNDNGIIYIDKSEDALKKAVDLIDSNQIKTEGEKARTFVENNDWMKVTDEFECFLMD